MRSSASAPGGTATLFLSLCFDLEKPNKARSSHGAATVKTAAVLSGKIAPLPRGRPTFTMINTASQSGAKYVSGPKQEKHDEYSLLWP